MSRSNILIILFRVQRRFRGTPIHIRWWTRRRRQGVDLSLSDDVVFTIW